MATTIIKLEDADKFLLLAYANYVEDVINANSHMPLTFEQWQNMDNF
jgi:hypothetical protein